MFVNEEVLFADIFSKALKTESLDVVGIPDAEKALECIRKENVDILITDQYLEKVRGAEFYLEAKRSNPFLQVLIMTAYADLDEIAMLVGAGVSDFIFSPFTVDQIRAVVEMAVKKTERWYALRGQFLEKKRSEIQ